MCGICGKISPMGVSRSDLEPMMDSLAHRGPDDQGAYLCGRVGLGSRRLSIIDLDGGRQPISNEDGAIWIVCNGEIYNYRALREGLEQRGHRFKSQSDTEVIVHLYEEMGEHCLQPLNGMFAFALWDARAERLMLARDRIGQKPLFYAAQGEAFWFASELKAILAAQKQSPEMNLESLHHYLSLRFIPAPRTMVQGICKLPAAHYLLWKDGRARVSRYWDLSFTQKLALPEGDLLEAIHARLAEAVSGHLVSDVPVGAFLSGGMDSSMVVALMAQKLDRPFKTFAIGVGEPDFNELPYARLVAGRYGTDHHEEHVEADLIGLLPRIVWRLDEPSDPIAACIFHAARLASRHAKVVLGGDGGDELFGGFDRYLGMAYLDFYSLIPAQARRSVLGPLLDALPDSFGYKNVTQQARWLHRLSLLPGPARRYAGATSFSRFDHEQKRLLYGPELWRQLGDQDSALCLTEPYERNNADAPLDKMLYTDFVTRLPEHTLMLTDRMSMAHGLEARAPFLDHTLVEFMAAVPGNLKIRRRTLKYALRQLARPYLPAQIVDRPKQGFMFPIAYWFGRELYPLLERFLLRSAFVQEGLFRRDYVLKLLEEHRRQREDHHVRLWMLLNVEIWRRLYLEGEAVASVEEALAACRSLPGRSS
jgi:asparagine synthase (glutamine-hydrolysing)